MANTHHLQKPISDLCIDFPADAGDVIEIGDLLVLSSGYAKPVSLLSDAGTEALNQAAAAPLFLGVANSARTGNESADGTVSVMLDRIYYFPCTSATYAVGDLVTFDENGDGDALLDQTLVGTTDQSLAIGTVIKAGTTVTGIWVRLTSRVVRNAPAAGFANLAVGTANGDRPLIKGIYLSAVVAVAVPTIADAETDEVAVDVAAALTMQPAVGDVVIAIPQEALPTSAILNGAYVSATDTVTVSFGTKEGGAGVTGANKNFKFLVIDLT